MYTVSSGVFVDGSIIDASDFLNEFGSVSSEMAAMDTTLKYQISTNLAEAKNYTNTQIGSIIIDGGTF